MVPFTGRFFFEESNDWALRYPENILHKLSYKEIYETIYKFFSNTANEKDIEHFNYIMLEYGRWLKENSEKAYTWDYKDFKPNYYLYNIINKR